MLAFFAAPLLLLATAPARAQSMECEGTASYTLQYDMAWSGANHPIEYPSGMAMFTPLWTFAHNAELTLWAFGETASEGVRLVAEAGDGSGLEMTADECSEAETCQGLYAPMCMPPDESSKGVCVGEQEIDVEPEFPYISSAFMLFPSPDWFSGVSSFNLCKDGKWVDATDLTLYPLDAGTDSGLTFLSPDLDTQPRAPITNFADIMPSVLSHFYNPSEGETLPVGTLYIKRN